MPSFAECAPSVLQCPHGDGPLAPVDSTVWACPGAHRFAVVAGVLDCRGPLTGFDVEGDRELALELAGLGSISFEQLLRRYWDRQHDVAPELAERFVTGDVIGGRRAAAVADQIEALLGGSLAGGTNALEIGGGTGALGAELAGRCESVVITDISLAWLVLAVRRVRDLGLDNVQVVAATGDNLPFERGSIDLIVAADVIEHVPDAPAVVEHCVALLRPGGALWMSTPNRLSLTPEPHVRLWGVGLLPRPLGRAYVRRRRGVTYDDIVTLSLFALRRLVAGTGRTWIVTAPRITQPVRATYRPLGRRMIDLYHLALRIPLARQLVLVTAPLFHVVVRRQSDG